MRSPYILFVVKPTNIVINDASYKILAPDLLLFVQEKKRRDLTHANDKSPYTRRKKIKNHHDNTKNRHQKPSITQRLRIDLGRSIGVTTVTNWCGLTSLQALNLPFNHNRRVIKRSHIKTYWTKFLLIEDRGPITKQSGEVIKCGAQTYIRVI